MKTDELRQAYLKFFESRGHKIMPSASLVPAGDPTLLLTAAGMVPFKPYFLGTAKPDHLRATTCQKCVRTGDIENVGRTTRHATFFEMLGNFSFGDYFKAEAIAWGWEFVTRVLGFSPEQLWITIYLDDDEAFEIWNRAVGVPADRIIRKGKKDNFWEIGVGPCGPCSEIHVDRGARVGCGSPDCGLDCDCGRFIEIWNLVFIQFHRDEQGNYTPICHR
jgi:alanyl-tRNA synthetase